jgi:hypothetical protein
MLIWMLPTQDRVRRRSPVATVSARRFPLFGVIKAAEAITLGISRHSNPNQEGRAFRR